MKYGIGILAVILLIIVTSVLVIGRGNNGAPAASSRVTTLADYAANNAASVSLTTQGRLVGQDQRSAVRITVTNSVRRVEVLSGYEGRVEKTTEQANTPEAFTNFTRAIDDLSFGRERSVANADERGICPRGNVFIYRLTDGINEIMRTWSTTCSRDQGPFGGVSAGSIHDLFKLQITNYSETIRGVRL